MDSLHEIDIQNPSFDKSDTGSLGIYLHNGKGYIFVSCSTYVIS